MEVLAIPLKESIIKSIINNEGWQNSLAQERLLFFSWSFALKLRNLAKAIIPHQLYRRKRFIIVDSALMNPFFREDSRNFRRTGRKCGAMYGAFRWYTFLRFASHKNRDGH